MLFTNIILLATSSTNFSHVYSDYKGLLQNSHLIWMCDWTDESLMNTVTHFFNNSPLATEIDNEIRQVAS